MSPASSSWNVGTPWPSPTILDDHAARALVNLATMSVEWHRIGRAAEALDRALRFTQTRDLDGYATSLLGHRSRLRLTTGDWAGARADAERALTGTVQPGGSLVPALVALGRLHHAGAAEHRGPSGQGGALGDAEPGTPVRRAGRRGPGRTTLAGRLAGTGGPRAARPTGWLSTRANPGTPASWRTGCGGSASRSGTPTRWRRPTGGSSRVTGLARPRSGTSSAARSPGPRRWPAATTRRPLRRCGSWTGWARSPWPAGSGLSCAAAGWPGRREGRARGRPGTRRA